VFAEQNVSITCSAEGNLVRWWLTRESGKLQNPCGLNYCEPCREGVVTIPRGYIIVRSDDGTLVECLFAEMNAENLERLLQCVAGALRSVNYGMPVFEESVFRTLVPCDCTGTGVCLSCKTTPGEKRFFVRQDCFYSTYCFGEHHWWSGVSDGVGWSDEYLGRKRLWSTCLRRIV
jgi:hypothetical protein